MWYSKKQNTAETATYGAEFSASRTCLEHVIDLRHTLRYLGVNVGPVSYVFGDNAAMITSSNFPYSKLNKRHNILSFHFVRGLIARRFIALNHVSTKSNVADLLSKHWSYPTAHPLLKPIFHHIGDTADLYCADVDHTI